MFLWNVGARFALIVAFVIQTSSPPERQSAFPFDDVAALMGFAHDGTAGAPELEVRITELSALRTAPTPLLRIVEAKGETTAQLFLWWHRDLLPPQGRPSGEGVRCRESNIVPRLCAKPLTLRAPRDWGQLARRAIAAPQCQHAAPTDTRDLKVQIFERGEYWRYGCRDPFGGSGRAGR